MAYSNGSAAATARRTSSLEFVNERSDQALDYYSAYFRRLARWYDLYRGIIAGKNQSYRYDIHIPFPLSIVQSSVSKKVQACLGDYPVVSFEGQPNDKGGARRTGWLISEQFKRAGMFSKAYDLFMMAELYGTGIARIGYRRETQRRRLRVPDMGRERVIEGDVVIYDGPDLEVRDTLDVWPQPGRRMSDCDYMIDRYCIDIDEVWRRAREGEFKIEAYNELKRTSPNDQVEAAISERMSVYRNAGAYEALRNQKYGRLVECREYVGLVPSDLAPGGLTMRIITVANRQVVLRDDPFPYWYSKLPFVSYSCCPDPHYFHGIGKMEIIEKPSISADRLLNQLMDALETTNDPMFAIDRRAGIETQSMTTRAGKLIAMDGPPRELFMPISPDNNAFRTVPSMIELLWLWMREAVGMIEGPEQAGSSRQTAREFLGRQEQVMTRVQLECMLADENFVEPTADWFWQLDQQYLPLPQQLKILGSAGAVNPWTGQPYEDQDLQVTLEDISGDYKVRAVGSTRMLGKANRQASVLAVQGAFQQNPILLQKMNWDAWGHEVLSDFDFRNAAELMSGPVAANQSMLSAAPGAAGTAPGSLSGPPQMSPLGGLGG